MVKQIKYNRQVNNLLSVLKSLHMEEYQDSIYYYMGNNILPLLHINGHNVNIRYVFFKDYEITFGLSALEIAEIVIKCLCIENCVVSIAGDTYSVTDYKFKLFKND